MFRRFLSDTRGNIAMMFALVTVPLIAATGAAIDYARAYEQRMVVQDALDAAALAANRLIGMATEDEIYAEAMAFFLANTEGRLDEEIEMNMTVDGGAVTLETDLPVPTMFLGLIGIDDINFGIRSVSLAGAASYEVVMVLDNSGSMRGEKLAALKVAAANLVNGLFALNVSNPTPDPIRIGLVPFASSVNVGPANRYAGWMDTGGVGTTAAINFDWDDDIPNTTPFTNRFAIYDAINYVDWLGCVEARPYPYDTTDAPPDATIPATMFQPMFAPDEPDDGDGIDDDYQHDYLNDDGGVCQTEGPTEGGGGGGGPPPWYCGWLLSWTHPWCIDYAGGGDPEPAEADWCDPDHAEYERCLQERVCKYQNVNGWDFNGLGEGPNRNCTVNALTPLSDNQVDLLAAITAMYSPQSPTAYTNIEQGIVWGWRVLSETEPFTEGRPYAHTGNQKILIVMTDGANTYVDQNTINQSQYMAFNYVYHDIFLNPNDDTPNEDQIVAEMNERTLEVCANIHETEITVYTIAFQVEDEDAQTIMEQCASDENKTYDAENNEELIAVFQLIAQDIATLRIAE